MTRFYPCDLNLTILSLNLDFDLVIYIDKILSLEYLSVKETTSVDVLPVLFILTYKEGLQGYKFMETQKVLEIKYGKKKVINA